MTGPIHAANLLEMVNGTWRLYGTTLCGIGLANVSAERTTPDPNQVTCKRCHGSKAWPHFYSRYLEHVRQGRVQVSAA